MHTKYWLENLMKTDHFRDLHTNTGITLKGMINTQNVKTWDVFHRMTIEYNGELI
jgi:hypothetical protein